MSLDATETSAYRELIEIWGEGNIPPGLSLAFEEAPIAELGIRKCRSFRADLVHKLNIICRGNGNSWQETARVIGVNISVLRAWRAWKACPGSRNTFQKIDSEYETAIERLRLQARGRSKQSGGANK